MTEDREDMFMQDLELVNKDVNIDYIWYGVVVIISIITMILV